MKNKLQPARTSFSRNFQCKKSSSMAEQVFFSFWHRKSGGPVKKATLYVQTLQMFKHYRCSKTANIQILSQRMLERLVEEEQQFFFAESSRIFKADVWTSTSSLAHISLASMTSESKMFLPSFELVSMKMALYSRAIFSPSSAPTHLLPSACPAVLWSTLLPQRMIGILFSDTSSILL